MFFQKLRANLWFASLTKQSFVWRQNYSPQALASLTNQSFVWRQDVVCNPKRKAIRQKVRTFWNWKHSKALYLRVNFVKDLKNSFYSPLYKACNLFASFVFAREYKTVRTFCNVVRINIKKIYIELY